MPLTHRRQKRLGYGGMKHPWRRRFNSYVSRAIAQRAGGGVIFLDDDDLLDALRMQLGLGSGPRVDEYAEEVARDKPLAIAFESAVKNHGFDEDSDWPSRLKRLRGIVTVYYALLREIKPSIVVETGTAAGGYTAFVAAALYRNGQGRLISIDIPSESGKLQMDMTVTPDAVGFLIPEEYRGTWTYLAGDAKSLLPKVLAEERVDVFIHDSLHTQTHMLFEYSVARALMAEGAVILSDDIMWNTAFNDFLVSNQITGYAPYSKPTTGVCVNAFNDWERRWGLGLQSL